MAIPRASSKPSAPVKAAAPAPRPAPRPQPKAQPSGHLRPGLAVLTKDLQFRLAGVPYVIATGDSIRIIEKQGNYWLTNVRSGLTVKLTEQQLKDCSEPV